jgi:putative inorganic carbon (HCO3(-)) transporter
MKIPRLVLGARLSGVSWFFIECFALTALFFLVFSKSVAEISVTLALALWILRKYPWNEPFPKIHGCLWAYGLFLAAAFLSLTRIPKEFLDLGWRGLAKWVEYFGIFFMSAEWLGQTQRRRRFFVVFLSAMALVALNGFYQMMAGQDLVKHYSVDIPGRLVRMRSSFGSPNDLAAFLLLALPLTLGLWVEQKKWSFKSVGLVAMLALLAVAFVATLSRSAFLALWTGVLFYGLFTRKWGLLTLTVLAPLPLFVSQTLKYNFLDSLHLKDITITERLRFWADSWAIISERPFLGHGINTYYQKFSSLVISGRVYQGYAHNCALQMWVEVGILGVAAFFTPFLTLPKKIKENPALGVGVLAFVIQSFFDTHFYGLQTSVVFWVFWGMLSAKMEPLPKTLST